LIKTELHEYIVACNGRGFKLFLRDAQAVLDDLCKEVCSKCLHANCKADTHKQYDPFRKLNAAHFEVKIVAENKQNFFAPVFVALPHCLKSVYSHKLFNQPMEMPKYLKKSDVQGFMSLKVIEELHKLGLVNEHLEVEISKILKD